MSNSSFYEITRLGKEAKGSVKQHEADETP